LSIKVQGFSAVHADTGKKIELAMQDLRLEGKVTELGAVLKLRHIFQSAEKDMIEAVYAFMLPRDASLRKFKVVGENFNVSSTLMETGEAKEVYEEGIQSGSLSVLAQQYRDGVVNLSIGNLRPGETVFVYIEVLTGVDLNDDGFRFRFPFTIAPGYHPKVRYSHDSGKGEITLPEDDFEDVIYPEWWKDASNLHNISFSLDMASKNPITGVSSPSHPITLKVDKGNYQVELATEKDVPNRDLILDARFDSMSPRVIYSENKEEANRFFALVPSTSFNTVEPRSKKIVFVVDRSGSMRGAAMSQAKKALGACLGALSAEDQFSIIAFDDRIEVLNNTLIKGDTPQREKATAFIQAIDARGGTELLLGIKSAMEILDGRGDIMVLTDGQVLASEEIINQITEDGVRVHCLGIGSASQDRFLTLLSRQTGGISSFITPRERVDLAALKLFSSIKNPVAEKIKVKIDGRKGRIHSISSSTVYPGKPLIIMGTISEEGSLIIQWKDSDRELVVPINLSQDLDYEDLKLFQGSRILTDIDSQITTQNRMSKRYYNRLMRKLLETSMEYGLASRAASLVAVIKRKDDMKGDIPRTVVVPVGVPQDLDFNSYTSRTTIKAGGKMSTIAMRAKPPTGLDMSYSLLKSETMAEPEEEETEADLLVEYAALIQPDGGMPGTDIEERIMNSLLFILEITQREPEVVEAFQIHLNRLKKFIEKNKKSLNEDNNKKLEDILTRLSKGEQIQGDWKRHLTFLKEKTHQAHKKEIGEILDILE
jgi:Ca-activated chloride channel family protein